ncbi:MAG: oligosaccharide flippase family protein [Pseudomonadota bacterium]
MLRSGRGGQVLGDTLSGDGAEGLSIDAPEAGEASSRRKRFLSSILTLSAGSTASQLITLALMPVITRLYDPAMFGIFAVFVALANIIIRVSNLQFAETIVVVPSEEDAEAAAQLAITIVAFFAVFIGALGLLFSAPLAQFFGIEPYGIYFAILAFAIFLGGLRQVLRRWLLRAHGNRYIASGEVSQALADRVATIAGFWLSPGTPNGLVFGRLTGQLCDVLAMLRGVIGNPPRLSLDQPRREHMKALAGEYRQFALYSWANLLDNAAQQLPVIMINALLGPTVAGGVALARRVLAEPAIILGSALAQSYYQLAAKEDDESVLRSVTATMTFTLFKLIALPVLLGMCCAPELFAVVFSEKWRIAGWYALIVSPIFMLTLLLRPLNRIFFVQRIQRERGIYAIQNILVIVVALVPAIFIDNEMIVLAVYSGCSSLYLLYRGLWLLGRVSITPRDVLLSCYLSLMLALVGAVVAVLARRALEGNDLLIVAVVVSVVLAYLAALLLVDTKVRKSLQGVLGKKFGKKSNGNN